MTRKCIVPKCSSTHKTKGMRFFRFPTVKQGMEDLSRWRLHEWKRIFGFRECFNPKDKYICSLHFISGKAAKMSDVGDVDWIPRLNITCIESDDPFDYSDFVIEEGSVANNATTTNT